MLTPDATETNNHVYLTFDDGPDRKWTPRVLDLLDAHAVRATFFVIGEHVRRCPAVTRRLRASGHEVGNHGFTHRHPWSMSAGQARSEVRDGAAAVADVLGEAPRLYRPPYGRLRRCMVDEARQCGEAVVLWDRSAVDWGMLGTATFIERRLARVQPGEIVLMHDARNRHNRPDQLLQVLPGVLRSLQERGLQPALAGWTAAASPAFSCEFATQEGEGF